MRLALLAYLGVAILLTQATLGADREWSDSTGKYKVQAEFAGLKEGVVELEKSDGSKISVPLERLSAADQAHVRTLATGSPAAPAAGKAPARDLTKWVTSIQTDNQEGALALGMSKAGLEEILKRIAKDAAGKPIEAPILAYTFIADEKHSAGLFLSLDEEQCVAIAKGTEQPAKGGAEPLVEWEVVFGCSSPKLAQRMGMTKAAMDAALREAERIKTAKKSMAEMVIVRWLFTIGAKPGTVNLICNLDGEGIVATSSDAAPIAKPVAP